MTFWTRRIAFIIELDGTIHVGRGDTHATMAERLGVRDLEYQTRGFWWPVTNELFFYTGDGTDHYFTCENDILNYWSHLGERIKYLDNQTVIWGGCTINPDRMEVVGRKRFGTIVEMRKL